MSIYTCATCGDYETRSLSDFAEHTSLHQPISGTAYKVDTDPFSKILNELQELHNKKKQDYAKDSDRFSNFKEAGSFSGIETYKVFEVLLGIKQARLNELRSSGKTPNNESLRDTLLDRCVYSILALMFYDVEVGKNV